MDSSTLRSSRSRSPDRQSPERRSSVRKTFRCPTCPKILSTKNGYRHVQTCAAASNRPQEPVQRLGSIREVLKACNIPEDSLACWDMEELEKLPNMRLYPLTNDKGRFTPWYVGEDRSELPTLGDLLVDIDRKMAFGKRTGATMAHMHYQLWNGTECSLPGFSEAEWTSFYKDIISGRDVATRIMNMKFPSVSETSLRTGFSDSCSRVAERMYEEKMDRLYPEFNITPRLTKTEVHFDCLPSVSASVGLGYDTDKPLKLWLIWPSTEIQCLESCVADTRTALSVLEHGRFFVQMPGEVVGVPASSPHAVIALNSCYIFGHSFTNHDAGFDPASICVDIRYGASENDAVNRKLLQLKIGLNDKKRRVEHAGHFARSWLSDRQYYNTRHRREKLIRIWTDDIDKEKKCILCELRGASMDDDRDAKAHVQAHLFNVELPDDNADTND